MSNTAALPDLSFYWSLWKIASIVIRVRCIVCLVWSIVSLSNHSPCLEMYTVSRENWLVKVADVWCGFSVCLLFSLRWLMTQKLLSVYLVLFHLLFHTFPVRPRQGPRKCRPHRYHLAPRRFLVVQGDHYPMADTLLHQRNFPQ